jgi:acylphosphatase
LRVRHLSFFACASKRSFQKTNIAFSGMVVASFSNVHGRAAAAARDRRRHAPELKTGGCMNSRKRLHVLYSGRVQGVGFRYTAKTVATGFEVTGIVRNLADGRVELIAEGLKDELEGFQQAIRESGLGSLIAREDVTWEDTKNEFRGFEITR